MEKEEKTRKGDRRGRQRSGVARQGVSTIQPIRPTLGSATVAQKCCGLPAREVSWSLRGLPLANSLRLAAATAGPCHNTTIGSRMCRPEA
jgi:hypothetical protein